MENPLDIVGSDIAMRDKVAHLEAVMREGPTVEIEVRHHFSKGVYAREIFIPKGTVLVGKIHKHENLNIISQGDISVLTENGMERLKAPFTLVSPPGTKRAGFAHEDTVWLSIHGTDETDVDKIELEFIAQNEAEYIDFCKSLQIEGE